VGEDVNESDTELMKTITPAKIQSWTQTKDWANESFAIAEQAQTKYCTRQGASCDKPAEKVTIDAAYIAASTPIMREQLQKGGVRVAHILGAALGKCLGVPTRPDLSAGVFLCERYRTVHHHPLGTRTSNLQAPHWKKW
jgi:hypothetical protein